MKYIYVGILFLGLILTSSCSRDYYCRCNYSYTGAGHPPDDEELITIKGSKNYAEGNCEERSAIFITDEGDTTTVECGLY